MGKRKKKRSKKNNYLNPFDATIIAQITPGEINGVLHSLNFAQDLVKEWLVNYKFKNWVVTETHKKPVTDQMKKDQAKQISEELINHRKWRSHGRSLKIADLENMGLKINKIDDDADLSDIVYRIQTVCRILFSITTAYKIFATSDAQIIRQAVPVGNFVKTPPPMGEIIKPVFEIIYKCQQCGKESKFFGKIKADKNLEDEFISKGYKPFPDNSKFICDCGFECDLSGVKNQLEINIGKKII